MKETGTGRYDSADFHIQMEKCILNSKSQAMPSKVLPVPPEAFDSRAGTEITWLGGAGILLNVRGTALLIDPLLTGFDMPTLFNCPLRPEDIKHLDAILVTHIDISWNRAVRHYYRTEDKMFSAGSPFKNCRCGKRKNKVYWRLRAGKPR